MLSSRWSFPRPELCALRFTLWANSRMVKSPHWEATPALTMIKRNFGKGETVHCCIVKGRDGSHELNDKSFSCPWTGRVTVFWERGVARRRSSPTPSLMIIDWHQSERTVGA